MSEKPIKHICYISVWSFIMFPLLFNFAGKSCVLCAFPMIVRNIFPVPVILFLFSCNNKHAVVFLFSFRKMAVSLFLYVL